MPQVAGRSRLFVLAFFVLAALAAASPGAGGTVGSSRSWDVSGARGAECGGPCKMFFLAKGDGAGVIRIRDAYGLTQSCVVPPMCARTLNYPENNGAATGVATMQAQATSGVFRGWENCPDQQPDGSCLVSIEDFVNTEYLCAIFTLRASSPVPAPGCPPSGAEPPPPPPDTTPPNTRITGGPRRTTRKRRATFRFASTEIGSRFRCRLDRRRWRPCRSPRTYVRLRPGTHTFRVRAIDTSGNRDPSPATRRWRVVR